MLTYSEFIESMYNNFLNQNSGIRTWMSAKSLILVLALIAAGGLQAQDKEWTLQECIDYALESNISVQQAELSTDQAELQVGLQKASVLPNLSAGFSHSTSWNRNYDATTEAYTGFEPNSQSSFSLSSSLTLFSGLQTANQIKQSKVDLESSELNTETMKETIQLNVLEAYLQVLYAQESLENAASQLELTAEQLKLAQERLAVGAIAQSDFLQIKSEFASEKLTRSNAKSDLFMAKVSLMQLMEYPLDTAFAIAKPTMSEELNQLRDPSAESVYATAMEVKPQIKQAQLNEESVAYDLKIAKGGYLPTVSVSGGLQTGFTDINASTGAVLFSGNQVSPSVRVSVSVPIFDKKQNKTNVQLAKISMENAKLSTKSTENSLRKEVEQSAANVMIAQVQYNSSVEDYEVSEESVKIAEEKFSQGLLNAVDFLYEKNNFIVSESNLLQAKYNLIYSYKVLDFFKGEALTPF